MTDEMEDAYSQLWGGKIAPTDARINTERNSMMDIDMPEVGFNPGASLQMPKIQAPKVDTSGIGGILQQIGIKAAQAALIAGGIAFSFVLPAIFPVHAAVRDIMAITGYGMLAAGGGWVLYDSWGKVRFQSPIVANSAFITPSLLQNTQVHTQKYSNPVNDLSHIKPGNRFDLQTNYVMNKPDESFDSRINDMILKEAKNLGFGTAGNYPVRMQPYQVKTLIPTTQTEPARDFNTVKMIG